MPWPLTRLALPRRFITASLLLLLEGCACLGIYPGLPAALLADGSSVGQRITHRVEWQDGDSTETFVAVLETHRRSVQLVAVLPTGISLFSLNVGDDLHDLESSALASGNIKPDTLLAMLQMADYPVEELAAGLASPWSLSSDNHQRTLLHNGTPVLRATLGHDSHDPIFIEDLWAGHKVTVTLLEREATP